MAAVRSFEELAVQNGRHSIIKDAKKYAEELDLQLWLNFPNLVAVADGKEVEAKKVKQAIYKARQQEIQLTVSEERWQGKLIKNRCDDEEVKLNSLWKNAPTHTIAGVQELYQQLLPTKVYYNRKAKSQVTVQYILSGCSALAQTKYGQRHSNAFSILFFEVLRSLDLITRVEPWFSQVTPKLLYENKHATTFWDVPLFADTTQVKANRINATVIDKTSKQVRVFEMTLSMVGK